VGEQGLKSWVGTVNEAEGIALLDLARPGMALESWRQEADQLLSQEDDHERALLIELIERMFLDHSEGQLQSSRNLRLSQSGWPKLREELFLTRFALAHPWTLLAARELIAPHLLAVLQPGAPAEVGQVSLSEWDAFVDRHIDPDVGEASRGETRSTLVGMLKRLGTLASPEGSQGPLQVCHAWPAPMVFGWVLAEQLRRQPEQPVCFDWAVHESDAALLFAVRPDHARRCVLAALQARLIQRVQRGLLLEATAV